MLYEVITDLQRGAVIIGRNGVGRVVVGGEQKDELRFGGLLESFKNKVVGVLVKKPPVVGNIGATKVERCHNGAFTLLMFKALTAHKAAYIAPREVAAIDKVGFITGILVGARHGLNKGRPQIVA